MTAEFRQLEVLHEAYCAVAAAEAARRLGVLAMLQDRRATAAEVARALDLDPAGTETVLRALAALGVVSVVAGRYGGGPAVAAIDAFDPYESLVRRLRDDAPAGLGWDDPEGAGQHYPDSVGLMGAVLAPSAARVAEHLLALGRGMHVLEIGAGSAVWSLALANRDPDCRITALDVPEVVERTRAYVEVAGCTHAYTFVGADLFHYDYPAKRFHLALVPNVCHLFGAEKNRAMFRLVRRTLRPGGVLAIVDVTAGEPGNERGEALYALSLLVRTSDGGVHAASAFRTWLEDAGFVGFERIATHEVPGLSLMLARTG